MFIVPTLVAALSSIATAQAPSTQLPVEHHAEPPLPEVLPSPMPTLPPPAAKAPGETPQRAPWFGSFKVQRPGYTAFIGEDGSISFDDRTFGEMAFIDPVRGLAPYVNLDITEAFMRANGDDPYLSDKLNILDTTRDERIALRRAHNEEVMHRALVDLPSYLNAVWTYSDWSASTRRRILFQLWDEAAEQGNDLVREGGEQARLVIARFIAIKLPPGSDDAFGEKELMALNSERMSRREFDPYFELRANQAEAMVAETETEIETDPGEPEIRRIASSF